MKQMKSRYNWLLLSLCLPLALPVTAQTQPCPGTGSANTCYGFQAGNFITTGNFNTATGNSALYFNTTGDDNTATGYQALLSNTTGNSNIAIGFSALYSNTTGYENTANGYTALLYNSTGYDNTANGSYALQDNTTGINNTANGSAALLSNKTGDNNTANGYDALYYNTTGSNNIALGYQAGVNNKRGSNNIDIGNLGNTRDNKTIRIGDSKNQTSTYIAGIVNNSIQLRENNGARPVVILPNGQLGVAGPTTITASGEVQKQQHEIASLQAENQALKVALKQQGIQLASFKQAQQQQLQMLSKLAMFVQTKAKAHPQKAIYQP